MYTNNKELVELVEVMRQTGSMPDELAAVLVRMCKGIIYRYKFDLDTQEMSQDFVVWALANQHRINTSKNVFSYLTTCCFNMLKEAHRSKVFYLSFIRRIHDSGVEK